MGTATNRDEPDYAVPPGWVLKDRLDAQGMTPAELARRCGRSAKLISEIVVGSLQHEGLLPWNHLNDLKARLQWTSK